MIGMTLNTDGELSLSKGKITLADQQAQSIELLLRSCRGELKQLPLIGGEVIKLLGDSPPSRLWCENIKKQLQSVGIEVRQVIYKDNQIRIEQ